LRQQRVDAPDGAIAAKPKQQQHSPMEARNGSGSTAALSAGEARKFRSLEQLPNSNTDLSSRNQFIFRAVACAFSAVRDGVPHVFEPGRAAT
jgi:hypothetical protein